MFLGANTLQCESSRERKFPGQFAPGNESSREREGQGAKVPGSELARVLLADSLQGANWPGSEKAVNHPNTRNRCEYSTLNSVFALPEG